MEFPKDPGIYVLVGCLSREVRLELRSLGCCALQPGIYCYCGSARGPGGLNARITHHLKKDTKKFWHFDYLKEYLRITQVWWQVGKGKGECEAAQFLAGWRGAQIPIVGFGSSDCRNGCASHLIYYEKLQSIEEIVPETNRYGFAFTRKWMLPEEIG